MEFSYSQTENFEIEKLSSDTGYFIKPVEINRGFSSINKNLVQQSAFRKVWKILLLTLKSFSEYVSRDESIMSDLMSKRNTGISSSQNSTLRSANGCNGSNTIPLSALTDVNFTPTRQVSFLTASLNPAVLCIAKLLRSWPMLFTIAFLAYAVITIAFRALIRTIDHTY